MTVLEDSLSLDTQEAQPSSRRRAVGGAVAGHCSARLFLPRPSSDPSWGCKAGEHEALTEDQSVPDHRRDHQWQYRPVTAPWSSTTARR